MPIILTDENFDKEVAGTDKFVLVDFFATWCEPCNMLAPILEEVADSLKDKIVLMKTNLDDAPKMADKFKVEKIPTVILFKNGQPISGFVGLMPAQSIEEWLEGIFKESGAIQEDPKKMIERLDNYAKSNGFRLNPEEKEVDRVVKGLLENEKKYGAKYCPCRRVTGNKEEDKQKICPCVWHRDELEKDGHCFCRLFVK